MAPRLREQGPRCEGDTHLLRSHQKKMKLMIGLPDEIQDELNVDTLSDVQTEKVCFLLSMQFRHIDELYLSHRAHNALIRNRIRLRCQLNTMPVVDILRLRYCGAVSINEIIQAAYGVWGDRLPNFREAYRLHPRYRELR